MVVVVYKKTDKNAFAVECTLHTKVVAILAELVESISGAIQSTT